MAVVWRFFSPPTYRGVSFFLSARSRLVDTLAIGLAVSTARIRCDESRPWRLLCRKVVDDETMRLVDQQEENRTRIRCVLAAY